MAPPAAAISAAMARDSAALVASASGGGAGRSAKCEGFTGRGARRERATILHAPSATRSVRPMTEALKGKVVLITGGARRVGAAICRRLHEAGAALFVHYRSAVAEARALQSELNARRADSLALAQADLLKLSALPELVKAAVKEFGRLDAVVNNASSFYPT